MPMKIAFFTARYSRSGVPLAQIRLANLFAKRGHDVDFIIGYVPDGLKLPHLKNINTIVFDRPRVITMICPIMKYLLSNNHNIIFSAEDHLNAVVLLSAIATRSRAKISISSRVTPFDTYSNKIFSKKWILKYFMQLVQSRADALVCVSKGMVEQYKTVFKNSRHQCIYNVVRDVNFEERMAENIDEEWLVNKTTPVIVSAGRLAPEKGFLDLIMAVKELSKTLDVKLLMLGEGPMRGEIENLIAKEHLSSIIKLTGFQENPLKYFSRADAFVLSSYVEGLPNVLIEAMMCGCTPISTDCPTGPNEVLQDGKYGYLVPMHDPINMAIVIKKAIDNPIQPEQIKEGVKPFLGDKIFNQYKSVLEF